MPKFQRTCSRTRTLIKLLSQNSQEKFKMYSKFKTTPQKFKMYIHFYRTYLVLSEYDFT